MPNARERLGWAWELNDKDMTFLQRLIDYSYKLGYIEKKLDASQVVDRTFANKAGQPLSAVSMTTHRTQKA